jgi:hypothetical protein
VRLRSRSPVLKPHPGAAAVLGDEFDAGRLEGALHLANRSDHGFSPVLETSDGVDAYTRRLGEIPRGPIYRRAGHSRLSAEIINFPRPFQPSREQRREAAIAEMIKIKSKYDKRGYAAVRKDVLAMAAEAMASIRASRERGEG